MKKILINTLFTGAAVLFLAGCTSNSSQLESNRQQNNNTNSSETVASSSQTTANSSTNSSNTTTAAVTLEEAIAIYQKQYPNTDITSIEIKPIGETNNYEIDGMDDDKEYGIYVHGDAQYKEGNGTDRAFSLKGEEMLDADERNGVERNNEKLDLNNLLPLDKINAIAQKEANNGTITEWSLERELNTTYWEVTVLANNQEVSVSIDAQSGNVLEVDYDD